MATIYKTGDVIATVDKDDGIEVDIALEPDE